MRPLGSQVLINVTATKSCSTALSQRATPRDESHWRASALAPTLLSINNECVSIMSVYQTWQPTSPIPISIAFERPRIGQASYGAGSARNVTERNVTERNATTLIAMFLSTMILNAN